MVIKGEKDLRKKDWLFCFFSKTKEKKSQNKKKNQNPNGLFSFLSTLPIHSFFFSRKPKTLQLFV